MFTLSMTAIQLVDCLTDVPGVNLKGISLMRAAQQAGTAPYLSLNRDEVHGAVMELIAYTTASVHAAQRLAQVNAVPLTDLVCAEWAL